MESDTTYSFRLKDSLLGAQMLFVAFGALVLVPILTGMSTNVALFTAGVGTLIFQICTRGKVPVFLASSFAFIAPIIYGVQTWGLPATLGGMVVAGAVYVVLSFIIRWRGTEIIMRLLPPIVTGPVIIVIGLVLAPVGVNMALGKAGDGSAVLVPENTALIISMAALATTVLVSLLGRGMIRLIPIMSGIAVGYLCAIGLGIHDFSKVAAAPWFGVPDFVFPEFRWEAILFIIPITLAPAIEHFGDIIAISSVTGKDGLKDPGIKSTMLGDGIATMLASFIGGPPNTTYSEVTGAVALTRAFNPGVMTWAAIWAIVLSCVNKLGAFLSSIPVPVMGGIMILTAIVVSVLLWAYPSNPYVWCVLTVLVGYGIIGFVDDYRKVVRKDTKGLIARWKYFWMSVIALGVAFALYLAGKDTPATELVVRFFKDVMPQLGLFYLLLAYFVIVGTGNAVNLTDGLDGLAIMPTVFVAAGFALVAWATGNMNFANYLHIPYLRHAGELVIVCTAIVGAGLGFLWFNTYPAQVFMGDVGSLALGGALGIIAVLLRQEFLLVIMGGVFVVETLSVILQVGSFKLRGQRIFRMAPIHHHYELKGWPEARVIVRFWITSMMLVLIGLVTLKVR
mgnify:FL=1